MDTNTTPNSGETPDSASRPDAGAPESPFQGEPFLGDQQQPADQPDQYHQQGEYTQQSRHGRPGEYGQAHGQYQQQPQYGQQPPYGAPGQQPYGAARPTGTGGLDDRTAAILSHLAAPIAALISVGWLSIVGPLVMWLIYRDKSSFVRTAAAQSFNFQITTWLTSIIGWVLCFTIILLPIGILLILLSSIASFVLGIWGAVKVSGGEQFRYPWNLPILN